MAGCQYRQTSIIPPITEGCSVIVFCEWPMPLITWHYWQTDILNIDRLWSWLTELLWSRDACIVLITEESQVTRSKRRVGIQVLVTSVFCQAWRPPAMIRREWWPLDSNSWPFYCIQYNLLVYMSSGIASVSHKCRRVFDARNDSTTLSDGDY